MKYACIAQHQDEIRNVRLMCRVLGVAPSGFYTAQREARGAQPLSPRRRADQRLLVAIRAAHRASHARYGAPRIHAELCSQGHACGHNRVARLMRVAQVRAWAPRAFRVTTQSRHGEPIAPNVVARRFAPSVVGERDRAWVADITYLSTREGWLYLAVVLDLASRRVIGWCADRTLEHTLALRALDRALLFRQPAPGVLHHSDRGVQYASAAYRARLAAHGVVPSMSGVGNCWDNAVAESFFATLKRELGSDGPWATRADAHRALTRYIDGWYNLQRRHSTLGYRSPVDYERHLARMRNP